jgi:hypothetical protein
MRPLSQPSFRLVAYPSRREPGPDLLSPRQRRKFPGSRAPSIVRSHLLRFSLALEALPSRPPLISRLCHRDPASDMLSRTTLCARLKHLAGYSPEPLSHMPPIDFSNWETHEHTNVRPNPVTYATASRCVIE